MIKKAAMDFKQEEYQCQFFNFTSSLVANEIDAIVADAIQTSTTDMKNCIIKNSENSFDKEAVEEITQRLITEYRKAAFQPLQILRENISHYFNIPEHILLQSDETQRQRFSIEDEKAINEELKKMKEQMMMVICLEAQLERELEIATGLQHVKESLVSARETLCDVDQRGVKLAAYHAELRKTTESVLDLEKKCSDCL